jgi:hypothetical protein
MTATVTGGGPVTGGTVTGGTATGRPAPARRRAARRRFAFPRASTTPGKVRLIRIGLVIGCLGGAETRLVIGSGPGAAGTLFGRLEADLDAAIHAGRAAFAGSAAAGSDAFTGLEAGIVVLALIMATGSAWGLSRRLAEYR